jgi:hypothetical protein
MNNDTAVRLRCPTTPRFQDDFVGCGHEFTESYQYTWVECPECGMLLNPDKDPSVLVQEGPQTPEVTA